MPDQSKLKEGVEIDDFQFKSQWTDPKIYLKSVEKLIQLLEYDTPHEKAIAIDSAMREAMLILNIAAPHESQSEIDGAENYNRIQKHLLLETCKFFNGIKENSHLYSQLLFTLLFNLPANEQVYWKLVTTD